MPLTKYPVPIFFFCCLSENSHVREEDNLIQVTYILTENNTVNNTHGESVDNALKMISYLGDLTI